ncbi:MAG: chemotaxis protein CheW [Tissierellaceae bacterium]|nr:chemotaxis protein CheW [Tissierellia bacterium]
MEQSIVFISNEQLFALYVSSVEKIVEYQEPKKLPDTQDYFLGIIQYDSSILPIIDLSRRLYGIESTNSSKSKIIVVRWKDSQIGLMVDDIVGIQSFLPSQFEDYDLDMDISNEYITGFIKSSGDVILVLNIDKLFSKEQEEELSAVTDG